MYYDRNLKLKLLIDFTKQTEAYSEFDRYLWTELKEQIILDICYLHFLYLFTELVCNYYGILPELKLTDFSWICGCFPRMFILNKYFGPRV